MLWYIIPSKHCRSKPHGILPDLFCGEEPLHANRTGGFHHSVRSSTSPIPPYYFQPGSRTDPIECEVQCKNIWRNHHPTHYVLVVLELICPQTLLELFMAPFKHSSESGFPSCAGTQALLIGISSNSVTQLKLAVQDTPSRWKGPLCNHMGCLGLEPAEWWQTARYGRRLHSVYPSLVKRQEGCQYIGVIMINSNSNLKITRLQIKCVGWEHTNVITVISLNTWHKVYPLRGIFALSVPAPLQYFPWSWHYWHAQSCTIPGPMKKGIRSFMKCFVVQKTPVC